MLKQTNYESKNNDYSRELRNAGNSYLKKCNFQNDSVNPFNSTENKIVNDSNNRSMISNFMLDTKVVPKIKLSTIAEKPKYAQKYRQNRKDIDIKLIANLKSVNVNHSYKSNAIDSSNQ